MRKYFGTDGIRGKVGEYPITPDFILKLGWAVGKVFAATEHSRVVIGKDTRISGYLFESALEAGLSAAGVDSYLLGPMPTPAIAYLTRSLKAQAGIVISASHNPYYDNGIKLFSADGKKLPDEIELAIEMMLEQPLQMVTSDKLGKAKRIDDAEGRYVEFCKNSLPETANFSSLKLVLDCANGASYRIAPNLFRELGAEVEEIASDPNGFNINEHCGSTALTHLQTIISAQTGVIGIAFDGDADRVLMVDEHGEIVDGDELLFILAKHYQPKGVVGTLMSNYGMQIALEQNGIEFIRTNVGDRHVMAALEQRDWLLGGESSGHIICRDKSPTGDGIIVALQIINIVQQQKISLHQLKSAMQKYPQRMINIKLHDKAIDLQDATIQQAIALAENKLAGTGRVLLRASGTEPLIRVMVEGQNKVLVEQLAEDLAEVVRDLASVEG